LADVCDIVSFALSGLGPLFARRPELLPEPALRNVGSKIHGDMSGWDVVATVAQRGADAVLTLTDGGIGQADGVEVDFVQFYSGDVDFDFDDTGVDTVDRGTEGFVEHVEAVHELADCALPVSIRAPASE